MFPNLLAQQFGKVDNPFIQLAPGSTLASSTQGEGLVVILTIAVRLIIVIAALYTFLNLILAGYGFISASGDPKAIQKAWEKIWQSIVGLLVIASSFVLAVVIGYLIFGSDHATILINPNIYSPT